MKRKILLFLVMTSFIAVSHAQKKQKPVTGYAITATEKGGRAWKEVRLVDIGTGEQVKQVYESKSETEPLNARTGKPVVKKDPVKGSELTVVETRKADGNGNVRVRTNHPTANVDFDFNTNVKVNTTPGVEIKEVEVKKAIEVKKKIVNLDAELDKASGHNVKVYTVTDVAHGTERIKKDGHVVVIRNVNVRTAAVSTYNPFATNSAACAYDKKHDRLYYTPMGINQLRYIDLKSNKVYYFEDEAFGVVKGSYDSPSQITRMVIASDGNGYALTNDANHLIRFTTGKNPEITDLGALTDDAKNTGRSVHGGGGGGDMIADAAKNLYLITAGRQVYKISIESKVATYMGPITGLPKGFSTNGAMVEDDSKVIIASSESTVGYYRFDLNTLVAEKVSSSPDVFNASDLANGNLAFDKKKKKKDREEEPVVVVPVPEEPKEEVTEAGRGAAPQTLKTGSISVYPNPVTNGNFRLSFNDQPLGRYQVQVIDMQGKLVKAQEVNIANKVQIQEFNMPELTAGASYLVKVTNAENNISVTNKIIVQ